ncbi:MULTISPECIES: YfiT family bacillithiol transferase [Bacillus]|uniref:YfiT family bacillithiol transferase n=1 Tax=Bacillus TaxID=1386 RepID=UPI0002E35DB8|nr:MULTISPECIES: putative metal-dependent hydrolase [Bacillus]
MNKQYPIGQYRFPEDYQESNKIGWINEIANLPAILKETLNDLSREQIQQSYRENGWTVQQLVHHIADSHMNAFIRFKLALTEENPTIKPYDEGSWALLSDTYAMDIESSLHIIEGLHRRWVHLLRNMTTDDYKRKFVHPELNQTFTLLEVLGLYAWHGKHHVAHIKLVNSKNPENMNVQQ